MQMTMFIVLMCLVVLMMIVWFVFEIVTMLKDNHDEDIEYIELLVSDILREINSRKKGKK